MSAANSVRTSDMKMVANLDSISSNKG